VDWIVLAQNRDGWRAVVNAIMNFWVTWNSRKFLTNWGPVSFSRRAELGVVGLRPCHLRVGLPIGLFPSGFPTKLLSEFLVLMVSRLPWWFYPPCCNHTSNYVARITKLLVKGVGLQPFACWDRGFESHPGHGCLSVVSVVCCRVEVFATDWSFVQRSPTDCGASLCVIK
jgi:hypothetical protein